MYSKNNFRHKLPVASHIAHKLCSFLLQCRLFTYVPTAELLKNKLEKNKYNILRTYCMGLCEVCIHVARKSTEYLPVKLSVKQQTTVCT